MNSNNPEEKFEFLIMGEHLLPLIKDLKDAGIPYNLGERTNIQNLFCQLVIVSEKNRGRVKEILNRGQYNSIFPSD